jgi:hypothetical protein
MAERKYRDYTITKSGFNYSIQKPNGERLCAEVPPTLTIAKKWIDFDIAEQQAANRRKEKNRA